MKNIIKSVIVVLSSVSLFGLANAGELSVSGTAKATYNIYSGDANEKKGLGITNELNFTASGELDNGYTWSYSMELDPADASAGGAATNDDTSLTMTTPLGTFGVFVVEGGLDKEDGGSQSVYGRPTDIGDPSSGNGDAHNIDSYNNVQYHTPADLLPFGIAAKVAYATGLDGTNNSGNAIGAVDTDETAITDAGQSATQYQVTAAPIDGLSIFASYMEFSGFGVDKNDQEPESGAYGATYASGPFSIGYSKAYKTVGHGGSLQSGTGGASGSGIVDFYEQTNYSVAYVASDNLSLSYEVEKDNANYVLNTTADVEQKSRAIQAAYTMGGMTIAVSRGSYDNASYTDGNNIDTTLFALTMAF